MNGAVRLTFEREPNYFSGDGISGSVDEVVVVHEGDRLACIGKAAVRKRVLNEVDRTVGYLGELRMDFRARRRAAILRQGYAFFHEQHRQHPCDFYFTSIASDNLRARSVLERGAPGLPRYGFLADFVTVLMRVPRSAAKVRKVETCSDATAGELAQFLSEEAHRYQLASLWTEEQLRQLDRHGLPLSRFHFVREGGRIVAAAALWDQSAFRQTVIRGYSPWLGFVRPVVNLAARAGRFPVLPPIGGAVRHAFVSPLVAAEGYDHLLPDLIRSFFEIAADLELDFVTVGMDARDQRLDAACGALKYREYRSRLYCVSWPEDGQPLELDSHRLYSPEVALL